MSALSDKGPEQTTVDPESPEFSFEEFLEAVPPNTRVKILEPTLLYPQGSKIFAGIEVPLIRLWCSDESCGGERTFSPSSDRLPFSRDQVENVFLKYTCRNC